MGIVQAILAEIQESHKEAKADFENWEKIQAERVNKEEPLLFIFELGDKHVFYSAHQDLHLFPGEVSKIVANYYKLDRVVSESLSVFQSEEFANLAIERKLNGLKFFKGMNEKYIEAGEEAIRVLRCYIKKRKEVRAWRDVFQDHWSCWSE